METLHQVFQLQAVRAPDAIAVSVGAARLSYGELNARANRIARVLRAQGVQRDDRVGLCTERGLPMIIGMLGILKAGGAYVPLDPDYPSERMQLLVEDSGMRWVVTTEKERRLIPPGPACVSLEAAQTSDESDSNPDYEVVGSDAAYLIYTSGSTGIPKGVVVEHRNVLSLFEATQAEFGFTARDVSSLFHSVAFDFSVWEMWSALLYGGRVAIVPQAVTIDPKAFHRLLQAEEVTRLSQTPSAFLQLHRAQELLGERMPTSVKTVVFGGEALLPATLKDFVLKHAAGPELVNMYGITETTVHVTFRRIGLADTQNPSRSPIGAPIRGLRTYLLDASKNPVRAGEVGEIYVAGPGVARGYHRRPELTAERFLPNPFAKSAAEERMYRSGDLAVQTSNGELEYAGRADFQLKVRGYRIEPGEIECRLLESPAVSEVVVTARDYGAGDKRLIAHVVPAARDYRSEDEVVGALRELAQAKLPDYMRPSSYQVLKEFPLNANGKVDRGRLETLHANRQSGVVSERKSGSSLGRVVETIWCDALGVPDLALDADFFDAGGTSLSAVKILVAVQEQLGVALDMSVWADHTTLNGFTKALEQEKGRHAQAV
jgi:arthrofactin-type cyclic lipopeptide synthetase C